MLLVEWIEENAKSCSLLPESNRDGSSVYLEETEEGGKMKITINYITGSSVVVDLDNEGQVKFFKKMGEESFDQRCDYLILVEQDDAYAAVFIELKTNKEVYESGGEVQLRWSLPYLEYLIAVFRTDKYDVFASKELIPRYFRISTTPSRDRNLPKGKGPSKRRTREPFESRKYNNIQIHYSTRDRFKFKDLIKREPVPLRPNPT